VLRTYHILQLLLAPGDCIETTAVKTQGGMMQGPQGMGPVMVLSKCLICWLLHSLSLSSLIRLFHTSLLLDQTTKRQSGRQAQLANIQAAKAVADVIRTTLGPRSMLKMLLDPMGSIILTNDGHCILREMDVSHPAAKSMIELSRATDEEVGDGTTSVIILAAEVLQQAEPFLRNNVHPTVIVQAYSKALQVAMNIMERAAIDVSVEKDTELMKQLVESSLSTKFSSRWNEKMVEMALAAVTIVAQKKPTIETVPTKENDSPNTLFQQKGFQLAEAEVDLKRYAKVEKIPGGEMDDCTVLKGVMFQKDTVHSSMRRRIVNPRILLLDCPLEYKKGETQTNMEVTKENDWNALLQLEEEQVALMCADIIRHKPDIVITEKGVSDLAQHYLSKANITAFRRLRKTDNNRIAKAVGATIVSRTDEIQESDLGTQCGLFEMRVIGSEPFVYLTECTNPGACTIVLRGGSKDVLNEIERNLQDAMQVVRNVVYSPKLVPGGGAIEMAVTVGLKQYGATHIHGIQQAPFMAVGEAMEAIPRTLAQNCGVSVIRTITQLRAKHASQYEMESTKVTTESADSQELTLNPEQVSNCSWGLNGITGELVDMKEYGIWEPLSVKLQTIQSAIESACMILRIDDIVSGSKKS
jgi:T-complex protein 1 subunit gamma